MRTLTQGRSSTTHRTGTNREGIKMELRVISRDVIQKALEQDYLPHRDMFADEILWMKDCMVLLDALDELDWHPITPDDPPQPYLHEVWGLHVGIRVVEPWMPDVYAIQGGWQAAGYTHMRLLNIPMPKKEDGQ